MSTSPLQDRALLRVDGLRIVAHGQGSERTIVDGVDLHVAPGETLGIVGESGSGKSMLMKAVLGLLPPGSSSSGEVWFDGSRIDQLSEKQIRPLRGRRLSLLLQDPFTILNPLQTIGETVAESLRPELRTSRAAVKAEVARRLAEVGIDPGVAAKRPFQLSGGMRQRVAIAAALAGDPDLLVADEPTTALDVSNQHEVLQLLMMLKRDRGMALILITHDLRVAFDVCSRVMVMYAGSVVEESPAVAMQGSSVHPYTVGLLLAEPPVDRYVGELRSMPGSVPPPDSVAGQCAFTARCAWSAPICCESRPALRQVDSSRHSRCVRLDDISAQLSQSVVEAEQGASRPLRDQGPQLLRIEQLSKTFHTASLVGAATSHRALDHVDLQVAAGEAVGLVGESGSGKTTIARSILGLSTPDEGRILIGDHDISDYRRLARSEQRTVRRLVQVVFQDPYASLNRSLTIGAALREAIKVRGGTTDVDLEVAEVLDRVSLPASYADRYPAALSGGERQRVSIARAVCMQPRLLICDEPVAALDVSVQAQILELLRELHDELGMAMLFITHDLAVVRQMTDRVFVLNRGIVVESGDTDRVLDSPQHSYTQSLVAAVPGAQAHESLTAAPR